MFLEINITTTISITTNFQLAAFLAHISTETCKEYLSEDAYLVVDGDAIPEEVYSWGLYYSDEVCKFNFKQESYEYLVEL